ncbi:hypothetical protein [Roseomonas chloroacetimidivorans]|jgi:hypothetical protein|uniref:hypothetical protein n=1 Tax=Roseomonas chloroacetimidivorans TaxID=1766656 RepID=UPI003C770D90
MADLPDEKREALRNLAHSVAQHRRGGGELDSLPEDQQGLLQSLGEAQRQVFMEELAKADAEEGRDRFRAMLRQWRGRQPGSEPDPEGVP